MPVLRNCLGKGERVCIAKSGKKWEVVFEDPLGFTIVGRSKTKTGAIKKQKQIYRKLKAGETTSFSLILHGV